MKTLKSRTGRSSEYGFAASLSLAFDALARLMKILMIKLLIFVVLLAGFYVFDGFENPRFDDYMGRQRRHLYIMWSASVALYCVGAFTALWGRQSIGTLHPVSLRSVYVAVGILAMIGGFLWMRSLRSVNSPLKPAPNQSMQRTEAKPAAQFPVESNWWLASAADLFHSTPLPVNDPRTADSSIVNCGYSGRKELA